MLHDPSLWVSCAFVVFVALFGRTLVCKIHLELKEYQQGIVSQLEQAHCTLTDAREALEKAQDDFQETQKTLEEIRDWTQSRLAHNAALLQESLNRIHKDSKRVLAAHHDVCSLQMDKEIKATIRRRVFQQAKNVFCTNPLGLPERLLNTFSQDIVTQAYGNVPFQKNKKAGG